MTSLRTYARQLRQLRRLNPAAASAVLTTPAQDRLAALHQAMQAELTRRVAAGQTEKADVAAIILAALNDYIAADKPIPARGLTPLWQGGPIQIFLRRDNNDNLRLVCYKNTGVPCSAHVGTWGRDTGHISGPKGRWVVSPAAYENIKNLSK